MSLLRYTGKIKVKHVVQAWLNFLKVYRMFREDNGLIKNDYSGFEICTSLSDKHGRICRQIKHAERNDHKSDWPEGMTEAIGGYLVYVIMLLEHYKLDMNDGLKNELESALRQYQDPKKTQEEDFKDYPLGI